MSNPVSREIEMTLWSLFQGIGEEQEKKDPDQDTTKEDCESRKEPKDHVRPRKSEEQHGSERRMEKLQ